MSSWYDSAKQYIRELDAKLPADLPFQKRVAAVRDAYPWGERKHWPYTSWLKAQREYLARFQKSDAAIPEKHLSPLERLMRKGA